MRIARQCLYNFWCRHPHTSIRQRVFLDNEFTRYAGERLKEHNEHASTVFARGAVDKEGLRVWLQQLLEDGTKVGTAFEDSFDLGYEALEEWYVSWTLLPETERTEGT